MPPGSCPKECVVLARRPVDVRNILILVALVILLAAGSAYSVYMFMGFTFGREPGAAERVDSRQGVAGPLLDVGSFTVNLAAGDLPSARYVRTGIVLEVDSETTKRLLEERQPQVRERVIRVLRQQTMESIRGVEGMERLKEQVQAAVNETLADGTVRDVYFVDLVVQ